MKTILLLLSALCIFSDCGQNPENALLFQQPFKWQQVEDVSLNADSTRFLAEPGTGAWLNGAEGHATHLVTKAEYADVRVHIEFNVPKNSNSGVYLMGRYEVQIRDNFAIDHTYAGDECGGIYQRWDEQREPKGYEGHSPRFAKAAYPPGRWQWFDIQFRAPRFDADGNKIGNAKFFKVYHNGYLVQENVEVTGPTRASLFEDEQPIGPLMLQGDHGPVAYRNIHIETDRLNPFFAMDTGIIDDAHLTFDAQANTLSELGFDGMDHTACEAVEEHLASLDANHLRLFAVYLDVWIDKDSTTASAGLERAIQQLAHRDVVLWVPLRSHDFDSSDPAGDEFAVAFLQKLADRAAEADLDIALYPHSFFMMEKLGDAVRIAEKVNRPNIGVTFNLCHWLRADKQDLRSVLVNAAPYVRMVSINGADLEGDWDRLIQPLDCGVFDVKTILNILDEIDYTDPIGLQGYGIGGKVRENLTRSMRAWNTMK